MSTIRLKVHNHSIALPADLPVAEGAEVQVIVPEEGGATLYDALRDFVGVIKDAPADLAAEHDHYAQGTPKRAGA